MFQIWLILNILHDKILKHSRVKLITFKIYSFNARRRCLPGRFKTSAIFNSYRNSIIKKWNYKFHVVHIKKTRWRFHQYLTLTFVILNAVLVFVNRKWAVKNSKGCQSKVHCPTRRCVRTKSRPRPSVPRISVSMRYEM